MAFATFCGILALWIIAWFFRVNTVQAFRFVGQVLLDYATIRGVDTQCMIAHGPSRMGRVVSYILAQFKAPVAS